MVGKILGGILGVLGTVAIGLLIGSGIFLGSWAARITEQGYPIEALRPALQARVQETLARRPYARTVDLALTSGKFQRENMAEYYEIVGVETAEEMGRVNRLLEKGFSARAVNLMLEKLSAEEREWLLGQELTKGLGPAGEASSAGEEGVAEGEAAIKWDLVAGLEEMLELDYFRSENLERYLAAMENGDEEELREIGRVGEGGEDEIVEGEKIVEGDGNNEDFDTAGGDNGMSEVAKRVIWVNIGLDLEEFEDAEEVTEFDELMVVNKYYRLGPEFAPAGMEAVRSDCVKNGGVAELAGVARAAFERMCLAAQAEGLGLMVNSAERGYAEQEALVAESAANYGAAYVQAYVSQPGYSEHQTGLALDVAAAGAEVFKRTVEYNWVLEHAAQYGFILRYPEGKEKITGYSPEAWHLRYVGTEAATEITGRGLTLEEYVAMGARESG